MNQEIQKTAAEILSIAHRQDVSSTAVHRALLVSEESYASVLLILVLDNYGPEVLEWHPGTIRLQLEDDFSVQLPKVTLDKILAAVTILTTNYFFKSVSRFIELCNILSGDDFQPDEFDPADADEILWGVTEAAIIYPPNNDPEDTEFSPEVRAYIEEVLKVEGIASPPDVLRLGARADATGHIAMNFSDDPEMFEAIWEVQRAKRDDLVNLVRTNLQELSMQLQLLRLRQGSVKNELVKQIQHVAGYMPHSDETSVSPSLVE